MALEEDAWCPSCLTTRRFVRCASTRLHLGEKTKWRCEVCNRVIVRIDGVLATDER